ncbi:MAG TPA: histidine--tRNA ligase [Patescibacteria group bacterium]|nr:histidine--tRNA ligase [Patescibacteria group bacterium]
MTLNTQPYKGARDFYPEDKRKQDYIFNIWREEARRFGYEEYDAPIIEPLEIYAAKTSDEIVNEQTYVFEDRGGRKVTLRPEMTPTVSRMVAGRRQELVYPLRWFSIPNLWRYERPQRGRLREHWQLNVDLFGVAGIEGDHELILLMDSIMQRFGAMRDMYLIRLSSRELIDYILNDLYDLDIATAKNVIHLIDKMHKLEPEDFKNALKELMPNKTENLLGILQSNEFQNLPAEIKKHPAAERVHHLALMLARGGITNAKFDITLVRGFDYYTDTVFEVFDTNPENKRSLFGGGRYDGLVGAFGVEPIPTIGFGMGDVTLKDFLEFHNLMPELPTEIQISAILIGDVYAEAQQVIKALREAGINLAVDSTNRKMDKQLKSAAKAGYKYVIFIGEEELANQQFNIKEMATGQEQKVNLDQIANIIFK